MLLVTIWWFVSAKKWFKGPKVNIEHLMLGREGNVVEGAPTKKDGSISDGPETEPESKDAGNVVEVKG